MAHHPDAEVPAFRLRRAVLGDVDFLADVVIAAARDQDGMPDGFDEWSGGRTSANGPRSRFVIQRARRASSNSRASRSGGYGSAVATSASNSVGSNCFPGTVTAD